MSQRLLSRYAIAFALLLTGACERAPMEANPAPADGSTRTYQLTCTADIAASRVRCVVPTSGGGDQALIIGGQNRYVTLASSNITVVADTFAFDVTVQNLTAQTLGTLDGTTEHEDGVRIFFQQLPTTLTGTGDIVVANPDGTETYTQADQPYYQYAGLLAPDAVSEARRWEFAFDPGVETFEFSVLVAAEVEHTEDYVDLSANPVHLLEGAGATFTGVVRTPLGDEQGGEIVWSSSAPEVATISPTGEVLAVAPGITTITATSGAAVGELSLGVCPVMIVGEVYAVTGTNAGEICLAGDTEAAEYVYVAVNPSTAPVAVGTTGGNVGPVTGPPTPNLIPTSGLHIGLRAAGARSSSRALSAGSVSGPNLSIVPGVPTVGDLWDLNVAVGCTGTPDERTGRVVAVGSDVIIVEDTLNPAGLSTVQYEDIANETDTLVVPTLYNNFGTPADIDGNGRVVAFFSSAVNAQVDVAAREYGYFASRDLSAAAECPLSNEGEMLYLAAADPAGEAGAAVPTDTLRRYVMRTLAHELQHLINASRRADSGSPAEEVWLDEGLSAIAEELVFYPATGLAPGQNISTAAFGGGNAYRVAIFQTYVLENFLRLQAWLEEPDTTGALNTNSSRAAQGALWAFLRYASDRAAVDDPTFWSSLIDGGETGQANLEAAIGGADIGAWLRDFSAALYVDDAVSNVPDEVETHSWDFRSLYLATEPAYPLLTRALADGVESGLDLAAGGGAAFYRFSVPGLEFASITSLSGGSAPAAPFQVIVVRTR